MAIFSSILQSVKQNIQRNVTALHHPDDSNIRTHYNIRRKLGTGAFGQVREAIHRRSKKKYAVKMILKSEAARKELDNEIDVMRHIQGHDNIIQYYELFEDKSFYYCVMELCQGETLRKKLEEEIFLSEQTAAEILKQILQGLESAHSKGVIHRDLKPENLMFSSKGKDAKLKLVDFGLACRLAEEQEIVEEAPCGTVYYIPPEACKGIHTTKADIWAIGVILYTVLIGMPPFEGKDPKEVMRRILSRQPTFANVSREAQSFLSKCFDKNHKTRMTASEALKHPFITRTTMPVVDGSISSVSAVDVNQKKKAADVKDLKRRQSLTVAPKKTQKKIDAEVRTHMKQENKAFAKSRKNAPDVPQTRRVSLIVDQPEVNKNVNTLQSALATQPKATKRTVSFTPRDLDQTQTTVSTDAGSSTVV